MISTVLGLAVEAFLVGTSVSFVHLVMKPPVRPVITRVLTVIVIMGERDSSRCCDRQYRRRNESFADGHGLSPVELPEAAREGWISRLTYDCQIEPHWNAPLSSRSWPAAKPELPRNCHHLFFSILVTVYCPFTFSASNLILSPGLACSGRS